MDKTLSVNSLHKSGVMNKPSVTMGNFQQKSIVEDNPQKGLPKTHSNGLWIFFKHLAEGTLFLSGYRGSSETPNHLSSTSSEYRMLMQESENDTKL